MAALTPVEFIFTRTTTPKMIAAWLFPGEQTILRYYNAVAVRGVDIRIRRTPTKWVIRFEVPYWRQYFRALTVTEGEVLNRAKLTKKFEWVAAIVESRKAADDARIVALELRRLATQRANLALERAGLAIKDFRVNIERAERMVVTLYLPTCALEGLATVLAPLYQEIHELPGKEVQPA